MTAPAWTTHHLNPANSKLMADDGTTANGGHLLPSDFGTGAAVIAPDTVLTGATSGSPHSIPSTSGVPVRHKTGAAGFYTPPASPADGQTFSLRDALNNSTTFNITITALAGTTINGAATYVINQNGAEPLFRYVLADTNWERRGDADGFTDLANLLDFPIVGGNDGLLAATQTIAVADIVNPALWPANTSKFRLGSFTGATATSSTVFTLKLNRGGSVSTVATATVAAGASVATWSGYTQPTEQIGDFFFLQGPATPDTSFGWTACTIPRSKQ